MGSNALPASVSLGSTQESLWESSAHLLGLHARRLGQSSAGVRGQARGQQGLRILPARPRGDFLTTAGALAGSEPSHWPQYQEHHMENQRRPAEASGMPSMSRKGHRESS